VRKKYVSLASNNSGIKPGELMKLLSFIQSDDLTHPTCKAVIRRIERIQAEQIKGDEL
jgi:hypothetical protein